MFSSGSSYGGYPGPASARLYRVSQTQEECANAQRKVQAEQQAYKNLIKKAAMNMFSNPEQLKNNLEEAVTAYLKEIENKWFRSDGRKRAEELKTKIAQAKTTAQLTRAITEVINAGNEEKDSLKTFIFNSINLNYCDNKLYNSNFAFQLKKIIAEIAEIQMLREKGLLCWAAFYSENFNFHCLSRELVQETTIKLNNIN